MLKPSNLTHSPFKSLIRFVILVSLPAIQSAPFAAPQNQDELARGSRQAIIDTGFSADYFDQHFKLIQVFNRPGDQRVVWRFSLNEFDARVTDSIGYSIVGGQKHYAHSIAASLAVTKDIPKTISRQRARTLMTSCIGNFENESVVLMKLDSGVTAALYLRANSWRRPKRESERERPGGSGAPANNQIDRPREEGGDERRPMKIGFINLETGKCTKETATATP